MISVACACIASASGASGAADQSPCGSNQSTHKSANSCAPTRGGSTGSLLRTSATMARAWAQLRRGGSPFGTCNGRSVSLAWLAVVGTGDAVGASGKRALALGNGPGR